MRSEVTEIFFSIYGPSTKRAGRKKKNNKQTNETQQSNNKTNEDQ